MWNKGHIVSNSNENQTTHGANICEEREREHKQTKN